MKTSKAATKPYLDSGLRFLKSGMLLQKPKTNSHKQIWGVTCANNSYSKKLVIL